MKQYDVTALILTYNPDLEKLIMTIRSFLIQNEIDVQIVIADDGSKIDYQEEIAKYLKDNHFEDFKTVKLKENAGTVQNVLNGLEVSDGEYIKLLSPGDYMNGSNVLENWIRFMKNNHFVMTGSNYICYHKEQDCDEYVTVQKIHPQIINLNRKELKVNYLLNNDIFLGAATLCKKDVLIKYIKMLSGQVKYAEDNCYRIMAYCDEPLGFYNQNTILYEQGNGISTTGLDKWKSMLEDDWVNTDKIMKNIDGVDVEFRNHFHEISEIGNKIKFNRAFSIIFLCIREKNLLLLKFKGKLKTRLTDGYLPKEWLTRLKEIEGLN